MSGNAVIDKKRVELVRDLPLSAGGHTAPAEGECPDGMCAVEKFAFITGQHWTDHPKNCCPTLAAFMRSFNDRTDQAGRDRLDAWIFENVEAIVATANDGRSEWRGFVSSDYAIRVALPVWLDLAGVKDAAAQLRALPEITDRALAAQGWEVVRQARKQLPDWYEARRELRRKVEAAVKKALADKKPAVAAAAAVAVAAADAAADRWRQISQKVYAAVKERMVPIYNQKFEEAGVLSFGDAAFELLDRMVAPVVAGQGDNQMLREVDPEAVSD